MTDTAHVHLTEQELRILRVLSDGAGHHRSELMKCLGDDLASFPALGMAISRIRAKLKRRGEGILTEITRDRRHLYRHVRFLRYDE